MVSPSTLVKSEFQDVFEKLTKGFLSKYSPLKKLLGYVIRDRKLMFPHLVQVLG